MVGYGYRSQKIDGNRQRKDQAGEQRYQRQDVAPTGPIRISGGWGAQMVGRSVEGSGTDDMCDGNDDLADSGDVIAVLPSQRERHQWLSSVCPNAETIATQHPQHDS